jgi:hypothetical protein
MVHQFSKICQEELELSLSALKHLKSPVFDLSRPFYSGNAYKKWMKAIWNDDGCPLDEYFRRCDGNTWQWPTFTSLIAFLGHLPLFKCLMEQRPSVAQMVRSSEIGEARMNLEKLSILW